MPEKAQVNNNLTNSKQEKIFKVSLEEAYNIAKNVFKNTSNNININSKLINNNNNNNIIIEVLKNDRNDTSMFILNNNNTESIIIAADKRVNPLLAMGIKKGLLKKDFEEKEGFKIWKIGMDLYMDSIKNITDNNYYDKYLVKTDTIKISTNNLQTNKLTNQPNNISIETYQNEYTNLTTYFIKNAITKNNTKIANDNPGPLCYSCSLDRMRNYSNWTCGATARCNDNTIYYTITKLLDNMAFWGQSSDPYNSTMDYSGCSATGNGRLHAGCVSTAVAQFLKGVYHSGRATISGNFNFYDMPNYFYNKDYYCTSGINLKNIMNYGTENIPEFLSRGWLVPKNQISYDNVLNLFNNINSTLAGGLSGSTVGIQQNCDGFARPVYMVLYNTGDAFGYLKNACGLNVDYVDYNYNIVRNQINMNTPVLIWGSNESGLFRGGHVWTIEGFLENYTDGNFTTYQYVCDNGPIDGGERGIIYQAVPGNGNNNTGYLYVREYNIDRADKLLFMNWGWGEIKEITGLNNNTYSYNSGISYNGWFSSEGFWTKEGHSYQSYYSTLIILN